MTYSASSDMTVGGRRRRRRRILSRLLVALVVLGVLLAGAALWLRQALPRIAATEIGRLMNARVEMGALDLRLDGSVSVAGLVVRPQQQASLRDSTILRAENVSARFSRRSLMSLAPRIMEIHVEGFLLDVQLDLNTGRWNVGTLRFNTRSGGGGGIPAVTLQRGTLRYSKISGVQQEVVMSVPVEARFGRETQSDPSYRFEIKTAKLSGGYGDSRLSGRWRPGSAGEGPGYATTEFAELTIAGGLSSADIPSLERAWAIDVLAGVFRYGRDGRYSLELSLKDLHGKHSPEVDMLRFMTPALVEGSGPLRSLQKFFAEYQPTGTVGSIAIQAKGNLRRLHESEVEGKVVCKDISVCDRDFPYRLDHLRGELEFTTTTLRLHRLLGKHGDVDVCVEGWTRGLGAERQYQYQITSPNMVLDKALYAALKPGQKRLWDAFQPTGTVAADYRLARSSPTDKRLYLSVDLRDVKAAFQGFPYPLTGLTGTLFFDRDSVTVTDVLSKAGDGHIRINGKVTDRTTGKPVYYLTIEGQDIPLDAAVRDALPAQPRELFSQFDVRGLADVRARVFSLSDVNSLGLKPSVAAADSGAVEPVGSEVFQQVTFLADVSCQDGSMKLPLRREDRSGQTADSVTPALSAGSEGADRPPLVLSNITAQATITPESLSIRRLEGRHGRSPVAITGGVQFGDDHALKQCRVRIEARQVPLDETTMGLLPPALMRQAAAFRPEGDVNLTVELTKADTDEQPAYTVAVDCLGNRIHHERFAYPLQEVRGTVSLAKDTLVLQDVTARPADEPRADSGPQGAAADSPAPATIRIDGSAALAGGRIGHGTFRLQATDLLFSERLGRALPKTLAGLYCVVSPEGSFDLDLTTLKVSRRPAPVRRGMGLQPMKHRQDADATQNAAGEEILVEFDGQANPKSCRLRIPGAALELAGAVQAKGSYSTTRGFESGHARLAAERLVVKGKTATNVKMEAVYDPNARKWTAENFVGAFYGGRLLGSLEVGPAASRAEDDPARTQDPPLSWGLEYRLQVATRNVDLQKFLMTPAEAAGGEPRAEENEELLSSVLRSPSSTSSGTMDASLSLTARVGSPKTDGYPGDRSSASGGGAARRGACRIDIENMQVGKVSPLGNVLSVLRLSEPTDYAFERMWIDSYIQGDTLLISKLDLSGRNAAFVGSGTMDLPTEEINLTLTGRGQRMAAREPSMLQSLTEGLGGAVVRMEVTGKARSPRVQTKALPVIEDSLRILGTPESSQRGTK